MRMEKCKPSTRCNLMACAFQPLVSVARYTSSLKGVLAGTVTVIVTVTCLESTLRCTVAGGARSGFGLGVDAAMTKRRGTSATGVPPGIGFREVNNLTTWPVDWSTVADAKKPGAN